MRRYVKLLLPILLLGGAAACAPSPPASIRPHRHGEIRRLIRGNLHVTAHAFRAVDARTVAAVRAGVAVEDIPVLLELLADRDEAVGIAAQYVLETFGEDALPGLRTLAASRDAHASMKAQEAVRKIESHRSSPK